MPRFWAVAGLAAALVVPLAALPAVGSGPLVRLSQQPDGTQADNESFGVSISSDGHRVAFDSFASNLVAGDTNGVNDIFVTDTRTGVTQRVSLSSTGQQIGGPGPFDGRISQAQISGNGRFVVFDSAALGVVPGDTNQQSDIFVRDLSRQTTQRVSVGLGGTQSDGYSTSPSISADGRYVAFYSLSDNLVPGDTNQTGDVFVRDLRTGTTERASVSSAGVQTEQGSLSDQPQISADGRHVVFRSAATALVPGDTNGVTDIFVRDLAAKTTVRVSVSTGGGQGLGGIRQYGSQRPSISGDGKLVAFDSYLSNLVDGGQLFQEDGYLHDLVTGVTQRQASPLNGAIEDGASGGGQISPDGRYLVFGSDADNLVAGDTNGQTDTFVRDLRKNVTTRVSVGVHGQGDGPSGTGALSEHARHVAFSSGATNLVTAPDTNNVSDIFFR